MKVLRDKKGKFVYKNGAGYRHWIIKEDSKCEWCNSIGYLEVDHIDKDRLNHSSSNLRILCHPCHTRRHKQSTWDRRGNNQCIRCMRTDIRSDGKGLCHNCYQYLWRRGELNV